VYVADFGVVDVVAGYSIVVDVVDAAGCRDPPVLATHAHADVARRKVDQAVLDGGTAPACVIRCAIELHVAEK
jgi:hypothetical protein